MQYKNPVYPHYFADPFVLKTGDTYYAYGTAPAIERDGRRFPILRSLDLVNWTYVGGALPPLAAENGKAFENFWAPEVAERDGKFYMYYSAAPANDDAAHRLRVAVADSPEGPFIDRGRVSVPAPFAEAFAIDASPFHDPTTGRWYLFFATDFFEGRVGTGTAAFELNDDMQTAKPVAAVTVLRATGDWHIYERNRTIYGKKWEAWHTVEGPFVWLRDGKYYCFYSGGNWQTPLYGVGYGVAESPLGPYIDEWNTEGPAVLRGIDNKVLGPGHCSVVMGPDGETPYMVYHAWDPQRTARKMCIDPLRWLNDQPRVDGPT